MQALVDKKKVIITETSIRSDLKLDDAEGIDCLPTATIFAELERMRYILQILSAKTTSWNEFSSTMASAIICLATNKNFNFSKYIFDNMVKNLEGRKVFANMKRPEKGFSGKVTPLFETMMVQATEDMGEDSAAPTDSHSTPIHTQPSLSKPQKKKSRRKQRKDMKSKEFGKEKEVKNTRVQEIKEEVTLVDETQEMNDDNLMFDTDVLEEQEKEVAKKEVSAADPVTTRCEYYDPALNVEVTTVDALTTTINELTLAQALIEIKAAKPKACSSAATTTTRRQG
ncbi:hypothetical protein Tco_0537038 [Tanacetum coccineum]